MQYFSFVQCLTIQNLFKHFKGDLVVQIEYVKHHEVTNLKERDLNKENGGMH